MIEFIDIPSMVWSWKLNVLGFTTWTSTVRFIPFKISPALFLSSSSAQFWLLTCIVVWYLVLNMATTKENKFLSIYWFDVDRLKSQKIQIESNTLANEN